MGGLRLKHPIKTKKGCLITQRLRKQSTLIKERDPLIERIIACEGEIGEMDGFITFKRAALKFFQYSRLSFEKLLAAGRMT